MFYTNLFLFLLPVIQNTTDAIGRAAAEAMQGPIQAAYKDAFQSIVLPVFERGCQSMFQQINDSFKQGTQECKATSSNIKICGLVNKETAQYSRDLNIWPTKPTVAQGQISIFSDIYLLDVQTLEHFGTVPWSCSSILMVIECCFVHVSLIQLWNWGLFMWKSNLITISFKKLRDSFCNHAFSNWARALMCW